MTDADLARWEAALRGARTFHAVPPVPAIDVLLLLAEVRRLRAELHEWQRSELPAHKHCTQEHCVAPN